MRDFSGAYDGYAHSPDGAASNKYGATLGYLNFGGVQHTNAGTYNDAWTFTDTTGNYNDASGSVESTLTKVDLTIAAFDVSKIYDGSAYTGSAWMAMGFVHGESLGNTSGAPGFAGSAVGAVNVGSYVITPTVGSLTSPNYNFANFIDATLTITKSGVPDSVRVFSYNTVYDGAVHTATGFNPVGDLDLTQTQHTNAGVYTDTVFFHGGQNYTDSQWNVIDTIRQAAAHVNVTPYNVTYNGQSRTATGTVSGVNNTNLASDLTITSAHTNAGTYGDTWSFTDPTGNYAHQSGTMTDQINKANATVKVTPYNVNYNAVVHSVTGTATGINGVNLAGDLAITSAHTNAGVYGDSWTFNDPNYVAQSGKFTDVINKANVTVKLAPYNVTYNGAWHAATGSVSGVNGQALGGLNLNNTVHINAGVYRDAWYFTDNTGNYNNVSGLMTDVINKANARIVVNAYNVLFDTGAHASTGVAIGVYGQALAGLNLGGTVHVGGYYTVGFNDRWTFTDTTGNYNSTSGIVVNTIQANQPLYRAIFKPFCPKSPFAGRLFIW